MHVYMNIHILRSVHVDTYSSLQLCICLHPQPSVHHGSSHLYARRHMFASPRHLSSYQVNDLCHRHPGHEAPRKTALTQRCRRQRSLQPTFPAQGRPSSEPLRRPTHLTASSSSSSFSWNCVFPLLLTRLFFTLFIIIDIYLHLRSRWCGFIVLLV